jgi:integrase
MAWIERRATSYRVRYRLADGTVGTDSSHQTPAAAELRRMQVDIDQATDTYLDPAAGRITVDEWVTVWQQGHDVGPARRAATASHLRNHILPRFGATPLSRITRHDIKVFAKDLHTTHANSTVVSIISLLSVLMREAVADRRIGYNPCQGVRASTRRAPERPHATPEQINQITARIARNTEQLLVITAAYTGMRWGELTGLSRANTHPGDGIIRIDPDHGALHEISGRLYLGPPKTVDSARDIHLPPFLAELLREHLGSHRHEMVFTGERGGYLRRSNFTRRTFHPAIAGDPNRDWTPVIAGMHFHDLRHTHKTWLIEDDIPEIAQAKRLGHRLTGIRGVYSHVTPVMRQRITDTLETRWTSTQPSATPRLRLVAAA